jgi:phospholipase A1
MTPPRVHPCFEVVWAVLMLVLVAPLTVLAATPPDLDRCAAIGDDTARLACYDALAGRATPPEPAAVSAPAVPEAAAATAAVPQPATLASPASPMQRHWELDRGEGLFHFRAHKPLYLLPARYSHDPNEQPFRAAQDSLDEQEQELDAVEAKFQLSFKLKLLEGLFHERASLWLGYTQQSHWQVYNESISRPFRETDYEPELMVVIRSDYDLLGLTGRFVNLGLVHQSNGRGEPLSRSWNRIYAQVGLERGDFGLYLRPWLRIEENEPDDDNPDIDDYYGYGDLVAQVRIANHSLAALLRGNISEGKGALQLDWTFPLYGRMKGYLQGFTGYGESLIDYNHDQTTIGVGVSFNDWF